MSNFDVIGDVHGHADALEDLLRKMGYRETRGAYRHPTRSVVFLGDLIDRGPDQCRTLSVARSMVEAGNAQIVMGNHEFNAIAWATRNDAGEPSRKHSEKNRSQHEVFLAAVGEDSPGHRAWIDWFKTIPMWLDVGGLRIVHACWHEKSMKTLGGSKLTRAMVTAPEGSPFYEAIEIVLKGPEIDLGGYAYRDKDGHLRHKARTCWWDPNATTMRRAALIPGGSTTEDGKPFPTLPDDTIDVPIVTIAKSDPPVLYGHYWRSGPNPSIDNPKAACLDWSIAKGGKLVAYRWDGEPELTDAHLVAVH